MRHARRDAIGGARRGEAHAVVALDGVAHRALGGDDAHDEAIGEERHFVGGVVVGRIGHRHATRPSPSRSTGTTRNSAAMSAGTSASTFLCTSTSLIIGHARDHEARLVELGQRLLVDEAEAHQALAERAAVTLLQRGRRGQVCRPQDPHPEEQRTGHVGHCPFMFGDARPSCQGAHVMRIYLDHNATTPLGAAARVAMMEALDELGNPSSLHAEGRRARERVERARDEVARAVGGRREEIVLTSGGTEANNLALRLGRRAWSSRRSSIRASTARRGRRAARTCRRRWARRSRRAGGAGRRGRTW